MATTDQSTQNKGFLDLDITTPILDISKKQPEKLIVILFNVERPMRGSLEHRLKLWMHDYANKVQFYKCVLRKGEQEEKTEFSIQVAPSFIFIRNGKILEERLIDLNEADPDHIDKTKFGEQTEDEKRLKKLLDKL